jgi:hypothetical protein
MPATAETTSTHAAAITMGTIAVLLNVTATLRAREPARPNLNGDVIQTE